MSRELQLHSRPIKARGSRLLRPTTGGARRLQPCGMAQLPRVSDGHLLSAVLRRLSGHSLSRHARPVRSPVPRRSGLLQPRGLPPPHALISRVAASPALRASPFGGRRALRGDASAPARATMTVRAPNRIAETRDHPRRGDSVLRSGVGWGAPNRLRRAGGGAASDPPEGRATHDSASRRSCVARLSRSRVKASAARTRRAPCASRTGNSARRVVPAVVAPRASPATRCRGPASLPVRGNAVCQLATSVLQRLTAAAATTASRGPAA
jgi:hypothetical protein